MPEVFITSETVCKALEVEWRMAHKTERQVNPGQGWGKIEGLIGGIWLLLYHAPGSHFPDLMNDIDLLWSIALHHYARTLQ